MGGCCSNREDEGKEGFNEVSKRRKIQQGGIRVYDLCGLTNNDQYLELCEECQGFKATGIQQFKRKKSRHSLVRIRMARNEKERVVVNVKFSSKTFFRIEIWPDDEESESDELSVEFISIFGKEQKSIRSLKDFFEWILKYDGRFKKMLKEDENMGKVVCGFFRESENLLTHEE